MPNPKKNFDNCRILFQNFLSSKGLRLTTQRLAILTAALATQAHYTAEELLIHAKNLDNSVSRATIYRTLSILLESNLLREIDIGKDCKYYLPNIQTRTFQAQVICSNCEKIYEIDAPFMEWYGTTVATKLGLEAQDYRLQVTAECIKIKQGLACSNQC